MAFKFKPIMNEKDLENLAESDVVSVELKTRVPENLEGELGWVAYSGKNSFLEKRDDGSIGEIDLEHAEPKIKGDQSISIRIGECTYNIYEKSHPEYNSKRQILEDSGLLKFT